MNRTYEEWLKYYENATKEQVIEDMMLDIKELKQIKKQKDDVVEYIKEHLTDNGRFLMLNEWQVPDLLRMLGEIDD